jgi:hypothetical protein
MEFGTVLYLSFVAASICFAVTETRLFQQFREEIKIRNIFFGKLVSCGYCLGYWVSGGLVVIYTPRLTRVWWPLDYLLSVLIIAWLSAFQWILMCCLMQKAGK